MTLAWWFHPGVHETGRMTRGVDEHRDRRDEQVRRDDQRTADQGEQR